MIMTIEPRHQIPLNTALAASPPGQKTLVENLYREARSLFFQGQLSGQLPKLLPVRTVIGEDQNQGRVILARVVDFETGFFVELSGTLNAKQEPVRGPFLGYGKFHLSEAQNPQLANTQTKLWR
jgi:hypothetical protein